MYDSALVPGLAQEWGSGRPFVGFLWLPRSVREAIGELADQHTEVLRWADDGVPPIFFGFGSMPIQDFHSVIGLIEQICDRTGQRALISVGGADVDRDRLRTGPAVKIVDALAHDLIFPHCKAAVHHGGIGTLFESLRADLPTLVCSVSFDQPLWGIRSSGSVSAPTCPSRNFVPRRSVAGSIPCWKPTPVLALRLSALRCARRVTVCRASVT